MAGPVMDKLQGAPERVWSVVTASPTVGFSDGAEPSLRASEVNEQQVHDQRFGLCRARDRVETGGGSAIKVRRMRDPSTARGSRAHLRV